MQRKRLLLTAVVCLLTVLCLAAFTWKAEADSTDEITVWVVYNPDNMNFTVHWEAVDGAIEYLVDSYYNGDWYSMTLIEATTAWQYSYLFEDEVPYGETVNIRVGARKSANAIPIYSRTVALHVPSLYNVYFMRGDGTNSQIDVIEAFENDMAVIPAFSASDVSRRGYWFLGWSEKNDASSAQFKAGDTFGPVTGNVYFYAVWKPRTYKVTYKLDGGKNNAANPSQYTVESDSIYLKPPTKAGYRFDGWYTDAALTKKSSGIAANSIGDRTFYAKFTSTAVRLSFDRNGGSGNAPAAQNVNPGTTVTIPKCSISREGYYFLGWSMTRGGAVAYKSGDKVKISKQTVLYAVWKVKNVTLRFDRNGGSGNAPAKVTKTYGSSVTVPKSSVVREGYYFLGWSTTRGGAVAYKSGSKVVLKDDVTLYAVWKKK